MTIYILILSVLLFFSIERNRVRIFLYKQIDFKAKYLLCFLVLLIVAGFRWNVGTDYINYESIFEVYQSGNDPYWTNFEIGFALLNKCIAAIANSQVLFLVSSYITLYYIFKTIKENSIDPFLSIFLFYTLYSYCDSLNIVRQYIAMAICFSALKNLKENELKKYVFKIILACFFHASAICMLPIYFLSKLKVKTSLYIILFTLVLLLFASYNYFIELIIKIFPQYSIYLNYEAGGATINLLFLFINFILLIWVRVFLKKRGIPEPKEHSLYMNICFLGWCTYFFSSINTMFSRIGSYFFLFSILSIPYCLSQLKIRERKILTTCIYGIVILIFMYYLLNNNSGVVPYNWYFVR